MNWYNWRSGHRGAFNTAAALSFAIMEDHMPTGKFIRGASPLDHFMSHVEIQPNGCWWWMDSRNREGYGLFALAAGLAGQKSTLAHRASYEHFIGPIPEGKGLDHTCHKKGECRGGPTCHHRRCVNPLHLEPVTQSENTKRGHAGEVAAQIQRQKTHCPQGHEYTPENTGISKKKRRCRSCDRFRSLTYQRNLAKIKRESVLCQR